MAEEKPLSIFVLLPPEASYHYLCCHWARFLLQKSKDSICGANFSIETKTGKSIVHGYSPQVTVGQMEITVETQPSKRKRALLMEQAGIVWWKGLRDCVEVAYFDNLFILTTGIWGGVQNQNSLY